MKHSKSTKAIALLMSMTMITSVFVGNTLSRYVTSVSSTDSARVAVWGINAGEDTVMNLFSEDYIVASKTIAASNTDGEKIMAPGTSGEAAFSIINFEQDVAPEVAYEVKISLDDSAIDEKILNNPSVQWKLDNGAFGTWDELKTAILSLSGNAVGRHVYGPGEFATAFQGTQEHKIAWQWLMDNDETITVDGNDMSSNEYDTYMGNLALTNDLNAIIKVSITATQVDDLVTNEYILDGANQTVNLNDIEPITIRSSADFSTFERVEVNGQPLTRDVDYTAESGSTVITLNESYLSNLAVGTYTIDIISNDVVATTKFEVVSVLDSGDCGDDLNWELLSNGTLHISGTGPMYDYVKFSEPSPWYKYRNEPFISQDGTKILNPDGTEYMGTTSYYNDNPNGYKIKKIVIDEGITYIGDWGFYRVCVEELTIPEGVISTGHFAIRYSPVLKTINLPNSLKELGDFGISRNLLLETINFGNGLETLGVAALSVNSKLKEVILPDSVVSINEQLKDPFRDISYENQGLLAEASSLTKVDLGSVTYIPQRTFLNCTSLESVVIPNTVEYIEEYAFFNTTSLKTVVFEEGSRCKSIGYSAFRYAPIESVTGGTALEIIENLAFSGASFKEFEFSDSNISFSDHMFSSDAIETASIGPNVEIIPMHMFSKSALKEVYISGNVKEFKENCFRECSNLENIYFDGTREDWNNIVKGNNWAYLTPDLSYSTVVHFSDGTTDILKNIK